MVEFTSGQIKDYYYSLNRAKPGKWKKLLLNLYMIKFVRFKENDAYYRVEEHYVRYNPLWIPVFLIAFIVLTLKQIYDGALIWYQGTFVDTKEPLRIDHVEKRLVYRYYFSEPDVYKEFIKNKNTDGEYQML